MQLVLIRHAESFNNIGETEDLDSSLSNNGFNQMQITAKWLKNTFSQENPFEDFIGYTSPLLRCLQTARSISHNLSIIPFRVDYDLREFSVTKENPNSPALKIKNRKEIYDFKWLHNFHKLEEAHFDQENLVDFIPRVKQFHSKLNKDGKYLIVSHGSVCRCLHALETNNLKDMMDGYSNFDFKENTSIKNCGITFIKDNEEIMFSKIVY